MSFKQAVSNTEVRGFTANGAETFESSLNKCVDLFFQIGAARANGLSTTTLAKAFADNPDVASRIVAWSRDIRGGAGERKVFRDCLNYFAENDLTVFQGLVNLIPEIGRWDDMLAVENGLLRVQYCYPLIAQALQEQNGLCAKWMPRKGAIAVELRNYLGFTPKQYRKTLVSLTNVVEQLMCAKDWESIEFRHVPSVAMARYKRAFSRHVPHKFEDYVTAVESGDEKINASAIFPYDVLKGLIPSGWGSHVRNISATSTEGRALKAQWEALPNYLGDNKILPMVDVSGSMNCQASSGLSCMEVAISLGLYLADKQEGDFKDMFLTFSERPEIQELKGDIFQKVKQLSNADWGMSTNVEKAFAQILHVAVTNQVSHEDMPNYLLILSDMEFNSCARGTNYENARKLFNQAGYELPNVVFWNLNGRVGNSPVLADATGTALVSGFSPSICKSVLAAEKLTPEAIMLDTVMKDRYKVLN